MPPGLKAAFPVLWALLLAETFAVSLFFQGIHDIRIAGVIGGLLAYGFAVAAAPGLSAGWRIPRSATVLFLLAFFGYMTVSVLWSTVPYISTVFVFIFSVLPFLFFSIVIAPDPRGQARLALGATGAVLAGMAVWGLIQFFLLKNKVDARVHHPLLDPNNFAILIVMPMIFTLGHFLTAQARRKTMLCLFLLSLFYAALLVTHSRSGVLVAGVSALVVMALTAGLSRGVFYKIPVLAGVMVAVFFLIDQGTGSELAQAISEVAAPQENVSVWSRGLLWMSTFRMAMDHFWGGVGLGVFYLFYPGYRDPRESSDGFFVHMDPLQFWAEMGILSPLLFYGFLICVLLRTDRALRAVWRDPQARLDVAAPFCALLALAFHAHVNFDLYVLPLLIPAGVLLAAWYAATESALEDARVRVPAPRRHAAVMIIIVALYVAAFIWPARAAGGIWLTTRAGYAMNARDVPAAARMLEIAEWISPGSYSSVPEYQGRLRLLMIKLSDDSVPVQVRRALYEEALGYFAHAEALNPRSPYAMNFEALLHYTGYLAGFVPDGDRLAIRTLGEALAIDPLFLIGRIALAEIYRDKGDEKKQLEILESGLPWPKPIQPFTVHYLMNTAKLHKKLRNDPVFYDRLFNEARTLNAMIGAPDF